LKLPIQEPDCSPSTTEASARKSQGKSSSKDACYEVAEGFKSRARQE